MDPARPAGTETLLSLQQTALRLGVSIDVLFTWNEHNILKPTITPQGKVGYKLDQIEQFLAIQRMLHSNSLPIPMGSTTSTQPTQEKNPVYIDFAKEIFTEKVRNSTKKRNYKTLSPVLFLSSVGVLLMVFILGTILMQEKILSVSSPDLSNQKILGDQTSTYELTKPLANPTQADTPHDKNLTVEGESILTSALSSVLFGKKTTTHTIKNSTVSAVAQLAIQPEGANGKLDNSGSVFASVSNVKTESSTSSIDANGNITGKSNNIASLIAGTNISESNRSLEQATDISSQVLLVIFGLGTFAFIMRRPKKSAVNVIPTPSTVLSPKVLEVDQRMDGTVVLSFQGNIYKISKPELNSDSDQFIERLMELVQPNRKEIEYDSLQDGEVRLTTPLSRLVTRLGFVGVKRDLFFPRTSKNNVLFRKYITEHDLSSMGLTTEEIVKDLTETA